MAEQYLYLFVIICFGLLAWGLTKPERVYQYPFFMGGIFVAFIFPQAVALINKPYTAPAGAVERVLLMACLCAVMCWIGYQFNSNLKLASGDGIVLGESRLLHAGIALAVIGNLFNYLILTTTPQLAENTNWTGPITIYHFFVGVSSIAFAILLMLTIRKFSFTRLLLTLFAVYPLFVAVFEAGRRQKTATLFIVVGVIYFFERRTLPPRWLALLLVAVTMLLIPLVGMLRADLWTIIFQEGIAAVRWTDGLSKVLTGDVLELRNAALIMEASTFTGKYGYGTGYWNGLVFQFVPGQLVGTGFKQALRFNMIDYDLRRLFYYQIPRGSTLTGIGDAFAEFGYLGCLFFAVQAHFFKRLWISATVRNDVSARILYAGLISAALVGVTHGTVRFVQELVFQWGTILIVIWYAKERREARPYHYRNGRLSAPNSSALQPKNKPATSVMRKSRGRKF